MRQNGGPYPEREREKDPTVTMFTNRANQVYCK